MSILNNDVLNKCVKFIQRRLPQACLLCAAATHGGHSHALICADCLADLPRLPTARCPVCALPSATGQVCGHCLRRPPAFTRARAALAYDFPLDALVQACKYGGRLAIADLLAVLLADMLTDARANQPIDAGPPDLILPMPLHPKRLAERGFNQAIEIGRRLAAATGIAWRPDACRRVRDTPPQAGLDLAGRRRNLRGAFECRIDLAGRRVALVDDVMTSGASLDELAREARRAGAVEVEAWVVARTL